MRAMVLHHLCDLADDPSPLRHEEVDVPLPAPGEILIRVSVCGVCHTELDEIEGRTPPPELPIIPGHQAIGTVVAQGAGSEEIAPGSEEIAAGSEEIATGSRVGVAWIYSACGTCRFCRGGDENLCADFRATGRDADGGYAEFMTVPAGFAHAIPDRFADAEAAPLLCAGAIGYRSLRLSALTDGQSLGLTGFGASAHLVLKMVRHRFPSTEVFVFARNPREREFACELGAAWAGDIGQPAPRRLDAIIDTTPAWRPIVEALRGLAPGGRLVVNAIRKENQDRDALLGIDYATHLWEEKELKSVANVTRRDVREFLQLAAEIPIRPEIEEFDLADANRALHELKTSRIRGAKVLRIDQDRGRCDPSIKQSGNEANST